MYEDAVLRFSEEPCKYYSEWQIHEVLVNNAYAFMDLLERFYLAWHNDENIVTQPQKQQFQAKGVKGDFRVMPCIIEGFEGLTIKAVKVIGTNEEEKIVADKICVGKALLINTSDNFVEGIFDVCALSSFRTAAISVLAFKHTTDISNAVGLIGLGRVGYYTAFLLDSWLGITRMNIYDAEHNRQEKFMRTLQETTDLHPQSLRDLCRTCGSVFLSTNSEQAILSASNSEALAFISSVGADADNLCELDHSLIKGRTVLSESRHNIDFGDLHKWNQQGLITEGDVMELREVIGLNQRKDPILFISTGAATQDALICHFIREKC